LQGEVKGYNSIEKLIEQERVWRFVVVCLDWGLQITK
jgi:hypothetical protein